MAQRFHPGMRCRVRVEAGSTFAGETLTLLEYLGHGKFTTHLSDWPGTFTFHVGELVPEPEHGEPAAQATA